MRPLPALALCASLAACAPWPDVPVPGLDAASAAPFPALVPLAPLLAQGSALTPATGPSDVRVAALQARAAALRGAVVDAPTRDRMAAGVDLGALPGS